MRCLCKNSYTIWKGDDFFQEDNLIRTMWECSNCKKSITFENELLKAENNDKRE